jgi:hypothetical protein
VFFCRYYCDYCDTHLTHDSVSFMNLVDCVLPQRMILLHGGVFPVEIVTAKDDPFLACSMKFDNAVDCALVALQCVCNMA